MPAVSALGPDHPGVYRLTAPAPGQVQKLAFELWPTAWTLAAGDHLKLEPTPRRLTHLAPDNLNSAMTLTNVSVTLPAHS